MMRLIDSLEGLNRVFETDIIESSIVIVEGVEGTAKSGFVYNLLSNYLESTGKYGVYVTLEQRKESHLANMHSMGIPISKRLIISDFSEYRQKFEHKTQDIIGMIETNIMLFKERAGDKFGYFALDSLGALYSLLDLQETPVRKQMYRFFDALRQEQLTSFIILEQTGIATPDQVLGSEPYIADGIIELGIRRHGGRFARDLRVRKMRAAKHSMEPWTFEITPSGVVIREEATYD